MKRVKTLVMSGVLALALVGTAMPVGAQSSTDVDVSGLALSAPAEVTIAPGLASASGVVRVAIQLSDAPLAVAVGAGAKQRGIRWSAAQQRSYVAGLRAKQDTLMAQLAALGAVEQARVTKAFNAVIVEVDAARLPAIAALPGVVALREAPDFETSLSATVPYIGATAAQQMGWTGAGVDVAILDSGIDYTHAAFGGAGTVAAFQAVYGTSVNDPKNRAIEPGSFPTARVVGGYDFVGEQWPTFSSALSPDPDPIDCGPASIAAPCAGGHGTNVADIIGGAQGVAPQARLWAVKICSAVSTSCSGVAIVQGLDYILDPNGDDDLSDALDVVNMSLGASYGQVENSSVVASANAVAFGVVVVASAGNSADRPYITGSPSMTPGVIGVAQTAVPSDKMYLLQTPAIPAGVQALWQAWSPAPAFAQGPLTYVTTSTATRLGCADAAGTNPYAPGSLAGVVLLMDRGTCAISAKIANAATAGAVAAIVANNVSQGPFDPPPSFSFGGGNVTIPGYTTTLVEGNLLKSNSLGATATINPAAAVSMVGSMVASSSRGPSYELSQIKPEIGAPGASVSAAAGSGTGTRVFGGTSGAAPMVAGSAALLIQKYPNRLPHEIKALLVGTAFTGVTINPAVAPGVLAPITRIGGGEVRVNRAITATTAVWDVNASTALNSALSFGYHTVKAPLTLQKLVTIRNYSGSLRVYTITPSFRYANDAASGAVTVNAPASIAVPGGQQRNFLVTLTIDPSKLPLWTLNGGPLGGDGFRLQDVEFDGFLTFTSGSETVTMPWHVLPRRAAGLDASDSVAVGGTLTLSNTTGARAGDYDVFALTGTAPPPPPTAISRPGEGSPDITLRAVGVRQVGSNIQFAVNTWQERSHPNYPARFRIEIDSDNNGTIDWVMLNQENSGFAATGQNIVLVLRAGATSGFIYFFTDADLNSSNAILTAPLSAVGLTPGSTFSFNVLAQENYFTGLTTSAINGMTFTPNAPAFVADGTLGAGSVPAGGSANLAVTAVNPAASPSQTGLLLMYRNAMRGMEAELVTVTP